MTPFYARMMDADAARERFAASAWIRERWPSSLREPTLDAFAWQAILNEAQGVGPEGPQGLSMDVLDRVLRETALEVLPLWILGVDVAEVEAAERAAARGETSPEIAFLLAARALSERRHAEASAWWERSRSAGGSRGAVAPYLWIHALASAGDRAGALRAARDVARTEQSSAATLAFWGFLHRRFGLDRPGIAQAG